MFLLIYLQENWGIPYAVTIHGDSEVRTVWPKSTQLLPGNLDSGRVEKLPHRKAG